MPISKGAAVRGIQDCKIAAVTVDSTSALTYGTLYDVPIKGFSIDPQIQNHECKHDDLTQEIDTVFESYEIKGTMGRVELDVLAIFTGASVTASGSGSAEKQTYQHDYNDIPSYFKLEVLSNRTFGTSADDVKDAHFQFPKCKITGFSYKIDDGFATIDFTARAVRTKNTGRMIETVFNETAVAIS